MTALQSKSASTLLVSLLLSLLLTTAVFGKMAGIASEWKGEYFDKKEGGFYIKIKPSGFKGGKTSNYLTGDAKIKLFNIIKQKYYTVSNKVGYIDGFPKQLWKLPSGKYKVKSVQFVDLTGKKRSWRSKKGKSILIKRQCVSNFGLWTISPRGKKSLRVKFEMLPNTYTEDGPKSESSVAAVIDGFTGMIQNIIAGKSVIEAADNEYSTDNELRATYKVTRQIAMFYKLNLFRHNFFAREASETLVAYDTNMRQCYIDRVDFIDNLKGTVVFRFLLSKSTGTMKKLKHTGGTLNDPKMLRCLTLELGQMLFPNEDNMIGELTYTFDVR